MRLVLHLPHRAVHLHYSRDEFKESEHPRAENGEFGSGGGGAASKPGAGAAHASAARGSMTERRPGVALPPHVQKLKIPPGWTDVRYSENPASPLQAIGRDAKGREVRVYSAEFNATQAAAKFRRVQELDAKFDQVRAQNELARKVPRTRDAADALALVMAMGIRPGSDTDTKAKVKAYGATTLEGRHVVQEGDSVVLRYVGKKGVALSLPVTDAGVREMLLARKAQAGDAGRLFGGTTDASLRDLSHSFDGGGFKPKDFRTLLATRTALRAIDAAPVPADEKSYKKAVLEVARAVSARLGNTPTVALQSYINPTVFAKWQAGAGATR